MDVWNPLFPLIMVILPLVDEDMSFEIWILDQTNRNVRMWA